MKKILFTLLSCAVLNAAQAQTEKGDWMVGGGFNLNTAKNNTVINLSPSAATFVANNLALGANVKLAYSKEGLIKTTTFGLGPWVRYYFTQANVRPIVQGNFNFISSKTRVNSVSSTNNGTNFFLGGGAAIFLSSHVSLDALLGYDHTKYNSLDGSGGFAMNVGFQVYLHRRQVERLRGK
ncbi:MAG: porin family protein [Chitinophagaceae bacterium]|nr:porin family protein [Chitinophagaceae bacterium]